MEKIKEGSLYKAIKIKDTVFHIYYGYNSNTERALWDPAPVFPDFLKDPVFTYDGTPCARADQDICECYDPRPNASGEEWCNDCKHFELCEELIGVCLCDDKKRIIRQNE